MTTFKLRPWPFDQNEEVELYWLCSPHRDLNQNWVLEAVFRKKDYSLQAVEYPWGTLPYLRLGQIYKSGHYLKDRFKGHLSNVILPQNYKGELCSGFDMPSGLYYFYKKADYGKQRLWKFVIDEFTYYIPCIELIRSLLTPSKTLANSILKPNGLDFLISYEKKLSDLIEIELTSDIPSSIANDSTAIHLVWLKYNNRANKAWHSVFNGVFNKAIETAPNNPTAQLSKRIPISVVPPLTSGLQCDIRSIQYEKNILVLELLGISDLYIPFKTVRYSHPSLKQTQKVNEPKKSKKSVNRKEDNKENELDNSGQSAKSQSHQESVEMPVTIFRFKLKPKVEKIRKGIQRLRTGSSEGDDKPERASNTCKGESTVSTNEPAFGGVIKPIEFRTLEVAEGTTFEGLEEFMKAVQYLNAQHTYLLINLTVVYLPMGKAFSNTPSGNRRTCAVAIIKCSGQATFCILEVARPDDWSISTLILVISANEIEVRVERIIHELLLLLIQNGGHWDLELFEQNGLVRFSKMKHVTNQDSLRWSERIFEKTFYMNYW